MKARTCAWVSILISGLSLAGWLGRYEPLYRPFSWSVAMALTTAIMFLISGAMVLALAGPAAPIKRASFVSSSAFMVLLLVAWSLPYYVRPFETPRTNLQVPPAIATLVSFALVSVAGLHTDDVRWSRAVGVVLSLAAASALLGYCLGQPGMYFQFQGVTVGMAVNTAAAFLFLGLAMVTLPEPETTT